jgi:dipeptidyl aminopeptidase/acylaminoacyl peptidase
MSIQTETRDLYASLFAPGESHVHGLSHLTVNPASGMIVMAGQSFAGTLDDGISTRLYALSAGGDVRAIPGTEDARIPEFSPDGEFLAWATPTSSESTLVVAGRHGLGPRRTLKIGGLIEHLAWSPNGAEILLVVAGSGADTAGVDGGVTMAGLDSGPATDPIILMPKLEVAWRRAWRVDVKLLATRLASPAGVNVWEAAWAGDDLLVIASDDHGEGTWYRASLRLIGSEGAACEVWAPDLQIGCPAASPDGLTALFVEAFCSDRGLVCGTLKRLDMATGHVNSVDTGDFEISSVRWGPRGAVIAGMCGAVTVAGTFNSTSGVGFSWRSDTATCGVWAPTAWPWRDGVLILEEDWSEPPRLCSVVGGNVRVLYDFRPPSPPPPVDRVEWVTWTAPDGLEIQGLLVGPQSDGPAPLVLDIHGGPVSASRRRWMARSRATPLLVRRGCRVLYANPRGSAGYGQSFARRVEGDLGGLETQDLLAGVDMLVARGLADPDRLACTGSSHGGFMSCWLATQYPRLAACAAISPVTNWVSQHGTSQIPYFDEAFLRSSPRDPSGRHVSRSPVSFVDRVRTPTLLLAGGRDRTTPPTQALEFYTALVEQGVETALITYPLEGHSLRGFPAYFDTAARITSWFARRLGLGPTSGADSENGLRHLI